MQEIYFKWMLLLVYSEKQAQMCYKLWPQAFCGHKYQAVLISIFAFTIQKSNLKLLRLICGGTHTERGYRGGVNIRDHWDHLVFVSLVDLQSMVCTVHLLHVEIFFYGPTDRPTDIWKVLPSLAECSPLAEYKLAYNIVQN